MAYKKGKGKMARFKKIEPAVQTMSFNFSLSANTTVNQTLDLSQCASLVNRRFYRQGINWAVSSFKVLTTGTSPEGSITLQKLPSTWVMSNAWEKGFRNWQRMNDEALEDNESVKPRFLDFKIYADSLHHAAGYAGNLLPISSIGPFVIGEWESSKVAIPTSTTGSNATDFELVAVGANYPGASPITTLDAVSLIEGYAASRGLPNVLDPNAPGDADDVGPTATPENWIGALKNEGIDQDKDILDRMVGLNAENNIAPYPFENDGVNTDTQYPNGANQGTGLQVHDTEFITPTTVGGTSRLKGGMFPCGLARFVCVNSGAQPISFTIQVDLVPGNHRGYLCEPMTDM